ncbi:hypothetical protein DFAR_1420010 [Desulfarculales bacterium]
MQASLSQLAALLGGRLEGPGDRVIKGIKGIEEAGPEDLAFLANPRYAKFLPDSRAGVVLVRPNQEVPSGLAVIRVDDPYLAYAKILTEAVRQPYQPLGVHPKAMVGPDASLGQNTACMLWPMWAKGDAGRPRGGASRGLRGAGLPSG